VHGTLAGGIAGAPEAEPWHGFQGRAQIRRWFNKYFAQAPARAGGAARRK
jgi:hypothetical protein